MAADPTNAIIAHTLHWFSVLLEIDDRATERVEAWRHAALTVRKLEEPVGGIVKRGGARALERLGFANEVAIAVADWVRTGELPVLVDRRVTKLWPALTSALCRTLGINKSPRAPRTLWESWH